MKDESKLKKTKTKKPNINCIGDSVKLVPWKEAMKNTLSGPTLGRITYVKKEKVLFYCLLFTSHKHLRRSTAVLANTFFLSRQLKVTDFI